MKLNAYGWTGPWRSRRGFDSLVQMSCGIADAGMKWAKQNQPTPLPVQALDHATGYLMAAAVVLAPIQIEGTPMKWQTPACELGSSEAAYNSNMDSLD